MKISELVVGEVCEITLVVKSAIAKETRSKKPYLALEFYDGTDSISANYWDWSSGNIPAVNSILDVYAQVTEWQGVKQLSIKAMKNNTTRHLAEFAPASGVDISAVYKDAYQLVSDVHDDTLRTIALGILEELRNAWLTVPGALSVHHAYTGGTLVHSYSVATLAGTIAKSIPEANYDLCVVGGLLHDVGKLFTYTLNGVAIDMTDEGRLYDHIFMGAEFVGNFAESHIDCDSYAEHKKIELLRHIILSHHGSLEFGSPVYPVCLEACIVSHADGLDSMAEQLRAAAKRTPSDVKWTERIYTLNNRQQLTPAYVNYVMNYTEEALGE